MYRRAVSSVEQLLQLRRARDLIDLRYVEPLDLAALAHECGYSRFHFARSFKEAFGETPGAYLTRRRIERAKDLLRGANLTVTEICHLVGFSSLGSFSARFRELVGCPPPTDAARWQRAARRRYPAAASWPGRGPGPTGPPPPRIPQARIPQPRRSVARGARRRVPVEPARRIGQPGRHP